MKKSYFLYGVLGGLLAVYGLDTFMNVSSQIASTDLEVPLNSASIGHQAYQPELDSMPTQQPDLEGDADLNQDGFAEHMVLKQGRDDCGSGGCTAFLYDGQQRQIVRMTVVRPPILVVQNLNHGWHDLIVWSNGAYRLMQHDGQSYPSNPSLAPEFDRNKIIQQIFKRVQAMPVYQEDGHSLRYVEPKTLLAPAERYQFLFDHHGDPHHLYQITVLGVEGKLKLDLIPKPEGKKMMHKHDEVLE